MAYIMLQKYNWHRTGAQWVFTEKEINALFLDLKGKKLSVW